MNIIVLTFHPESLATVENRLAALFPKTRLEVEFVYPRVIFAPEDRWEDSIAAEVQKRIDGVQQDVRILHVKPADFIGQLLGSSPPALAVIAYNHWSERVGMTANMLAVRNFPTLILGYKT